MNIFDFFSKFKDFDNITDFRSVPSCQFFSKVVDYGINTGKDFQFYEIYCDAIIETINQGVPEKFKLRLQLSQFQSASICLNILMSQKNFHKMYDLVVKAFSDVRVVEKENAVAYDKIDIFFKAKILNNSDFIRFLFPLFYYDESNPKVFSHICEDFKEHYKAVLYYHLTNGHMEYLREVLGLLSWAVNRDAAFLKGDFWNKVKYIYDENILSCEDHAKVGVALVTNIGVVYGVNVKNNAYELYKNFHQCLGAHEVLQVLLSIVSHDYNELLKYKKDILYEVAKYYAYLDHKNLDEYAFFYERSRIFSAIYIYYILTALEASDEVLASELYYFWENKGQEIERIPKSLIIIPNRSDELIIGKTRISSKQHDADLSDLINIQNQCLQLQELNNIDPKVEMVKAERLGVPNEKLGGKYLAQLQKFYKFSKWPDLTGYEDYLLLNNTNHPIQ